MVTAICNHGRMNADLVTWDTFASFAAGTRHFRPKLLFCPLCNEGAGHFLRFLLWHGTISTKSGHVSRASCPTNLVPRIRPRVLLSHDCARLQMQTSRTLKPSQNKRIIPFMVKKNIKNTIKTHNLINPGEHIVIGLSGGPDSVCLFSVLNELKEELGITLHAVHVNHGFRPGAADEDQQYVEQLCAEKGVECTSFIYDCNAIAREQGLTSEEAGRKVRYASFLRVAEGLMTGDSQNTCGKNAVCSTDVCQNDDFSAKSHMQSVQNTLIPADKIKIAVAQNADDQAETVLFRLLRGTGTDGLAGIAYRRNEQNIEVIRPLLDTWRKDIEAYCDEHGLQPRTDHTNLQPIYTRNKIRLDLIPYLQENFNANIMEALGRLSRIASEDKDYLWKCADEAYNRIRVHGSEPQTGTAANALPANLQQHSLAESSVILNQGGLAELEPAIRHRVVMRALQDVGLAQDVTAAHLDAVDSILAATGESKTIEFPDGYRVSVRYGEVAVYHVNQLSDEPIVQTGKPNGLPSEAVVQPGNQNGVPKGVQDANGNGEVVAGDKIARFSFSVCQNADFSSKCPAPEQKTQKVSRADGQNTKFDKIRHAPEAPKHASDGQSTTFDKIRHAAGTPKHTRGTANHQTATFDADKIAAIHGDAQPVLRTRREGDYIAIKGGRKKLQNLFVDMKVPKEYRDSIKIAAIGSEILWLPVQPDKGIKKARYSHRYKLDADTKKCLMLEFDCEI